MKKIINIFLLFTFFFCSACANENSYSASKGENMSVSKIKVTINGVTKTAILEENAATKALAEKLQKGNITYNAHDYGGFEKVGDLGFNLPTEDRQMTSQSGDIFLYVGSSLVIFYGENSWSYTKIGTLEGMTKSEVKEFLRGGMGNVSVTLSLE